MDYYNEFDPKPAAVLRELIRCGVLPPGVVDDRSITEVCPQDLSGFRQCHFFAGIGGWALALKLAGYDQPCWTGSCPCQPFSAAGKRLGTADLRHLFPYWSKLIAQCGPRTIFGEQVASKDALGWLDIVFDDLEDQDYACWACDLPAAGVGAPQRRQRIWYVAHHQGERRREGGRDSRRPTERAGYGSELGGLAEPISVGWGGWNPGHDAGHECQIQIAGSGPPGGIRNASGERLPVVLSGGIGPQIAVESPSPDAHVGNADCPNLRGFWRDPDWVYCRDGTARPIESGTFPLAHGVPARVGRLRGYGNAIVPQVAAEFIGAFAEIEGSY